VRDEVDGLLRTALGRRVHARAAIGRAADDGITGSVSAS
jgi:hypothetical protein